MDILGTLGPWLILLVVGGWVVFMVQKKGWKVAQIIAGGLLLTALYGNFPQLPNAIHDGMVGITKALGAGN